MKTTNQEALVSTEMHRIGLFITPEEREFLRQAKFYTRKSQNELIRDGLRCLAIQLGIPFEKTPER